ncbi:MAG: hypothetical protein JWR22_1085 [Herminiimonas sp.]|nr:hypothetical protein [Herminiimonas sp.]
MLSIEKFSSFRLVIFESLGREIDRNCAALVTFIWRCLISAVITSTAANLIALR